jgi:hypothetical protein
VAARRKKASLDSDLVVVLTDTCDPKARVKAKGIRASKESRSLSNFFRSTPLALKSANCESADAGHGDVL